MMTVATIAPAPESVSVEMNIPIEVIPAAASRMKPPATTVRTSVDPTDSVVPESVGNGPNPNTTPPARRPARITPTSNAPVNAIADAYFPNSSLVRPTGRTRRKIRIGDGVDGRVARSEEHTSELQSRPHLVCRLLLEKKKKKKTTIQ